MQVIYLYLCEENSGNDKHHKVVIIIKTNENSTTLPTSHSLRSLIAQQPRISEFHG